MRWTFGFSFWVINGLYDSGYNSTLHSPPKVIEVDDCGPDNLVSAAYAFWLVLVPAVACVVHQPGSLFLFRRSNFYRFSPELGIVDALSVLPLIVKALRKGYRWDESVAAVFAVRRGIGQGNLWWRKDLQTCSSRCGTGDTDVHEPLSGRYEENTTDSIERLDGTDAPGATESAGEEDHSESNLSQSSDDDYVHYFLASKFAPILAPLSQKRVFGAAFFLVSFLKVIAMLGVSANSGVRLTCYLALAYSTSYLALEILAWSCVFPFRNNSLIDLPQNLVEVVRLVDPGDNPFTFMGADTKDNSSHVVIPLRNLVSASTTSLPSNTGSGSVNAWSNPVTIIALFLGLTGPLMWILVLSNVWDPVRCALVLAAGAITFIATCLAAKYLYRILRRTTDKTPDYQSLNTESGPSVQGIPMGPATADPFVQYNTHGTAAFFSIWVWRRVGTVNVYSAIWIAVICYYFIDIFPVRTGLFPEDSDVVVPQKPSWLDWL